MKVLCHIEAESNSKKVSHDSLPQISNISMIMLYFLKGDPLFKNIWGNPQERASIFIPLSREMIPSAAQRMNVKIRNMTEATFLL